MKSFLKHICKACNTEFEPISINDNFCSKECEKEKIELLHNEFRVFTYTQYRIIFNELRIHQPGIRYSQRQPPIFMQINLQNGKCWCGKPKEKFDKFMRKYCCNDHSRWWFYYINSYR